MVTTPDEEPATPEDPETLPTVRDASIGLAIGLGLLVLGSWFSAWWLRWPTLGLGILFGTPTTTEFDCTTGESLGAAGTEFAGSSGLQYDPETNTYTYVWKTKKAWAGDCRTFRLTFDDGTYWEADFHFTR